MTWAVFVSSTERSNCGSFFFDRVLSLLPLLAHLYGKIHRRGMPLSETGSLV